jgi:hypothetical protein
MNNTFSQGNESWKRATEDMKVYAYNPGLNVAEGTLQANPTNAPDDTTEDDWPYTRTIPSPGSGRMLKSLISRRRTR